MNNQNKKQSLMLAISVIAAIAFVPLAAGSVFAEANTDVASDRVRVATNDVAHDRVRDTTTDALRDIAVVDVSDDKAKVKFGGSTYGWAIIGGQAFPSEIGISGIAVHQGNGVWDVDAEGEIFAADRHAKLDLTGKAYNGHLRLHGTGTLDTGEPFRILLRGHFAPVYDQPGDFVVAFTFAKIHNLETGLKIPLIQHGIVHVEPYDTLATDDYEEFLEEFDVAG